MTHWISTQIAKTAGKSSKIRQGRCCSKRGKMTRSYSLDVPVNPANNFAGIMRTRTDGNSGKRAGEKSVYLIANGDLRLSANQKCWSAQQDMERALSAALKNHGWRIIRAHEYSPAKKHGFIDGQKMGMEVFRRRPEMQTAPLIVAESVWQYSHHVLHGLTTHRGPILSVANWSGTWPGLVGTLNLNGSMTKAGITYSSFWSENFSDRFFNAGMGPLLTTGRGTHDTSHVKDFELLKMPEADEMIGRGVGRTIRKRKAIMGVFDEGCMGMYNAIIPDELLHQTGIFKERLSQSTLYAAMQQVSDADAQSVIDWLLKKGMRFAWGQNEETELTHRQTVLQCKMYIAVVRL